MKFELPKLEYEYGSLEPFIDEATMKLHHDKHHQTYTDKFNEALEKHPELKFKDAEESLINLNDIPEDIRTAVRNHGGGYVNHSFFWEILKKDINISGKIKEAIEKKFGNFDNFKKEFSANAVGVFGSGWAWLVLNEKKEIEIIKTQNQDSPLTIGKIPLLVIDVWEHAYYLKYQNRRAEYVENFFNIINWQKVEENFLKAMKMKLIGMKNFNELAEKEIVEKTIEALKMNGIQSYFVKNKEEARKKVMELVPKGAEVMNMTSETLENSGIAKEISSGRYDSVREKLSSMSRETSGREMQKTGAAPEYVVGSVHAITQDGKILIASNTGSQLPAYVYGADKVIFVAGTQKIVKDLDEAIKRLYEYTLPLESERARKAYKVPGSFVSKALVINREIKPERIQVVFVNEVLGY